MGAVDLDTKKKTFSSKVQAHAGKNKSILQICIKELK
jgi:hypothetical protein